MAIPLFTAEKAIYSISSEGLTAPYKKEEEKVVPALPCIYGRWCGPGCSGPGAPVDSTDECCMNHDHCYEKRGYFACSCDRELLSCLAPKRNIWTKGGRAAWAVWSWFNVQPCNPFK